MDRITDDGFERNWRRKLERKMRPVADELYWQIIPGLVDIHREYRMRTAMPLYVGLGPLDRELGIDVIFTLRNGMKLTCQEKFGSPRHAYLEDVTVEYYNDPVNRVPGDWFTMLAQLYFFGFANEDLKSFGYWVLLNWPTTVLQTIMGTMSWEHKANARDGARADFMRTFMANLPNNCIIKTNYPRG